MPDKITFFESYYRSVADQPDDARLSFYESIFAYAFDGTEPSLTGVLSMAFTLVKPTIDSSIRLSKRNADNRRNDRSNDGRTKDGSRKTTVSPSHPEDRDKDWARDGDKDAGGCCSSEQQQPPAASDGAGAGRPAPPSANGDPSTTPICPLCSSPVTFSPKDGWSCPVCGRIKEPAFEPWGDSDG